MSKIPALLTTASSRPNSSSRPLHDCGPALGAVHGVVRRDRDAAPTGDLLHDLIGHARVRTFSVHRAADVVDDDRGTALRQIEGVQPPEATASSGHDDRVSGEVDHVLAVPLGQATDSFP